MNLLIDQATWVHRRVESIEHFDRYNVRRRVSLDLAIPKIRSQKSSILKVFPVPLATLEKRPLKNLDVTVGIHGPVPVMTSEENSDLITGFLVSQARLIFSHDPGPELKEIFRDVALMQPTGNTHRERMAEASKAFTDRLDTRNKDHQTLRNNHDFINLIQTYGSSFELVALVPAHEGQRLIVKYAYDDVVRLDPDALDTWRDVLSEDQRPVGRFRTWARRSRLVRLLGVVLQRLGLGPTPLHYPLPGIGSASSYHIEVTAPAGLEIHDGLAMAWQQIGQTRDLQAQSRCGPSRRAHLHVVSATQGALGRVRIRMRPASAGWLRAAALSSLAIAGMLAVGSWGDLLGRLFGEPQPSARAATAGLLIALPGILAVILVRTGEHALTSRLLFGIRLLLVISAGLAYVAAGFLLLADREPVKEWLWMTIAGLIIAAVIVVAAAWPPLHTRFHGLNRGTGARGSELQNL